MKSAAHHTQKQAEMLEIQQTAQYGDMRTSAVAIAKAIAELRAELAVEAAEREAAATAPAPAGE